LPRCPELAAKVSALPTPSSLATTLIRHSVPGRLERSSLSRTLKPGRRVAVAVGSRGIANVPEIGGAALKGIRASGAEPFIVLSMESHGGALPFG
jgi:hypothetical protein